MEGSDFVTVKRGRSNSNIDADIIKIKRSETPDDIFSAIMKEEMGGRVDDANDESKEDELIDDNVDNREGGEQSRGKDGRRKEKGKRKQEQSRGKDGRRKEKGKRKQPKRHVSHGYHLVEGKMKHGMEDFLVATRRKTDGHELGLYGIFDGHSGNKVAEYLADHLFDNILNEPDFWTNPKAAIKRVYESMDKDILENVVGSRGGSTAVTAILIDREKLVVANVGDSRAVLCKDGAATQITVEHEPLKEREMVESKGGFVSWRPGNVPRVDGQLSMTRAFGDERLKHHITAEPDIAIKTIDEDVEFIILASDGLWKVMSNQEAVDCIRGLKDGREAAQELIKEALSRESKDDISCVVMIFHD